VGGQASTEIKVGGLGPCSPPVWHVPTACILKISYDRKVQMACIPKISYDTKVQIKNKNPLNFK